jgi:hypothetical protein
LLEAARRLRCDFGDALDVEWSFDADGVLFIHQVRPITWKITQELAS